MKTNKLRLFTLLALGGLISLAPIVRADDAAPAKPATPPADADTGAARPNMREQMEKMFTTIKATDDQKEKLKGIFKERNQKFKELRDDTSVSKEDRAAKRKDINQGINAKVKEVLSEDQYKQYMDLQKEQGKRGHKPAAPPAADTTAPKN